MIWLSRYQIDGQADLVGNEIVIRGTYGLFSKRFSVSEVVKITAHREVDLFFIFLMPVPVGGLFCTRLFKGTIFMIRSMNSCDLYISRGLADPKLRAFLDQNAAKLR